MRNTIKFSSMIIFLVISTGAFFQIPSSEDEKHVKSAILDYVEGVYEADTLRIYRSVHPILVKRGVSYNTQEKSYCPFGEMTFQQLINLTKNWNRDGKRANSNTIRDIRIYDVQEKTATAKVVAAWGIDYFHLAKMDDEWYIINVLGQSQKPN